jgi:hypothetical protein
MRALSTTLLLAAALSAPSAAAWQLNIPDSSHIMEQQRQYQRDQFLLHSLADQQRQQDAAQWRQDYMDYYTSVGQQQQLQQQRTLERLRRR